MENDIRYLVTGGAGFIGSNLCRLIVAKGHSVIIVDDLSSGNVSNLKSIINSVTFYEEKVEFFDFNKVTPLDAIIHLAAQPSVQISINHFESSSSGNILSSIKIINFCSKNKIPLIYASSSAIYGNLELGNDESHEIDLLSSYANDKYVMELYARTASKLYQLSSIGLRFFNVYGPYQDPSNSYSGVISIFIDQILKGKEITVNGGFQTRDFIYVGDVVDIIFESILLAAKKQLCEHTNVLTGKSVSIDNLADILIKQIDTGVSKKYKTLPIGDPKKSSGTSKKMINLFNINLSKMVSLELGLSKTVDFIQNSYIE